ncbi:hypothetical protein [Rhizobium leguminosarum]|nr:hypothetical protein [Rhizobium leguminosarum]
MRKPGEIFFHPARIRALHNSLIDIDLQNYAAIQSVTASFVHLRGRAAL